MDDALNADAGIVCIECIVLLYRFFKDEGRSSRECRCACDGIVDKCSSR